MRHDEQELKDWIDDIREKIIKAESVEDDNGEWLFDKIPSETVVDMLDLLCQIQIYVKKISEMKSKLLQARLQDESNPNQTVKMIIEKGDFIK